MTSSPIGSTAQLRVLVEEPIWAPESVFGTVITARQQLEAFDTVRGWGYWDPGRQRDGADERRQDRDEQLVKAAGRWHGRPLTPPLSGRFVPGDIAAMRTAVARDDLARRAQQRLDRIDAGETMIGSSEESAIALDSMVLRWLYHAVPYFVDLSTLIGLVDCELPTGDELDDLVLPAEAVAVFFGGDIGVPMELIEADRTLEAVARRQDIGHTLHPEWTSADDTPATSVTSPVLAIAHRRTVRVCGIVMHADTNGRLDDLVMWLTAVPEHLDAPRNILYGWLSRSTLRHAGINLAAAVAWGQWTNPTIDADLFVDDPTSREFRDIVNRGRFRRQRPAGGAVAVRVLDVRHTIQQPRTDRGGTHASPVTHRRRRHWRRQRVGPCDNWAYERRLIEPVIVNPGQHALDDSLTVYRLPLPPPIANGRQARESRLSPSR